MKNHSKKSVIVLVFALVAMLATAIVPGSAAFALLPRNVHYATVNKVTVVSTMPASFRLRGTYTCDKVQITSAVSGKSIWIYAYDVKNPGSTNKCLKAQGFNRVVNFGKLAPGKYTVWVNPTEPGLAAKKFTFIVPGLPTRTPIVVQPFPGQP